MALPETVGGLPVEMWAIKSVLSRFRNVDAERRILEADNPIAATRAIIGVGGFGGPDIPWVWFNGKGIIVSTKFVTDASRIQQDGVEGFVIPYSRVVEYVRERMVGQVTLF